MLLKLYGIHNEFLGPQAATRLARLLLVVVVLLLLLLLVVLLRLHQHCFCLAFDL